MVVILNESEELKLLAGKMIEEEADRFLTREPDHQVISDTKAEENAWNSDVISLAYNMFPKHPHHAAWLGVCAATTAS